jgi:solute carrier family 45 protein 3
MCNQYILLFQTVAVIFEPFKEVYRSPPVLQRLFMTDLLCWMALMSHNMFCTDYVATVVYGGKAEAERGSLEDIRFDEGVRMGSLGLLLHSTTGMLK